MTQNFQTPPPAPGKPSPLQTLALQQSTIMTINDSARVTSAAIDRNKCDILNIAKERQEPTSARLDS